MICRQFGHFYPPFGTEKIIFEHTFFFFPKPKDFFFHYWSNEITAGRWVIRIQVTQLPKWKNFHRQSKKKRFSVHNGMPLKPLDTTLYEEFQVGFPLFKWCRETYIWRFICTKIYKFGNLIICRNSPAPNYLRSLSRITAQ